MAKETTKEAPKDEPAPAAPPRAPKKGEEVRVRYLDNPNAIETEGRGVVTAVDGMTLAVVVPRPGRVPVTLDELAPLDPKAARQSLPYWIP